MAAVPKILRKARRQAERRIFDRPGIKKLQAEVTKADAEIAKAARKVKTAKKQLKKTTKPSKTLLQRVFSGSRGGGGGGGAGFEFDKLSGKLRRRKILQ